MPVTTLPLGLEVVYRGMKGSDEELLTNEKKVKDGLALDELLASCTVKLGDKEVVQVGDIERLETPDRNTLLLVIRRESYGDTLDVEMPCPHCKAKQSYQVDLSERPMKAVAEDYLANRFFERVLSDGKVVRFKYLNGKTERQLAKKKDGIITAALALRLVEVSEVHANDRTKWLLDLPVKMRRELSTAMQATDAGPETLVTVDCEDCGLELAFDVMAQPNFFFPGT